MLSAALCRAQEAHQLDRAATAVLENVRLAATRAADAWNLEAVAAERRERPRVPGEARSTSRYPMGGDDPYRMNVRLGPEED